MLNELDEELCLLLLAWCLFLGSLHGDGLGSNLLELSVVVSINMKRYVSDA